MASCTTLNASLKHVQCSDTEKENVFITEKWSINQTLKLITAGCLFLLLNILRPMTSNKVLFRKRGEKLIQY